MSNNIKKVMILTHGLYPVPGYVVSGNGIRAWSLTMGLVRYGFEVIYATPSDTVPDIAYNYKPRPEVTLAAYFDKEDLHSQFQLHRPSVLIIGYWAYMHLVPSDLGIPLVIDLLAPWLLESAFQKNMDISIESIDYLKCLNRADYFLCCTQRQKAYHTAWLLMSGVDIQNINLAVIPISTPPELPLKPAAPEGRQKTFLYGGVLWPWRHPQKWISELLEILRKEERGCLQLVSGKYPLHKASSSDFLELPKGPQYDKILKHSELLPYDEMLSLYLQADVGIELSSRNYEREFSLSFRLIDYLRCGLPVICNDYIEVSDLIRRYDAGWVLDSSNQSAFEAVVKQIVAGKGELAQKSANARRLVRDHFNLYNTIKPLIQFCKHPFQRQRGADFLFGLMQYDGSIREFQTRLEEQRAYIIQVETQKAEMTAAHTKAIAWHEANQLELNRHYGEISHQVAAWQKILEDQQEQHDQNSRMLYAQISKQNDQIFEQKAQISRRHDQIIEQHRQICEKQAEISGLQNQMSELEPLLSHQKLLVEEHRANISQLQTQIRDMLAAHAKAVDWHQKTQSVLYQHYDHARTQLAQWQHIAEERRLSTRLRRFRQKRFTFRSWFGGSKPVNLNPQPDNTATCLFDAHQKNIKVNLSELSEKLHLQYVPELLQSGKAPFEHQQQALDRFLADFNVEGKTILEVGADDAVVLSRFAERGMSLGLGINNWYWETRNPKTIKVADRIILSWGDIRSVPIADASFDIIFTIAAFEHIHDLETALQEMYRLLKPGGMLYSLYGPVWSSGEGHHLWFEREGRQYRFSEPETIRSILDAYEHLLLDRHEMAEKLCAKWDSASVDDFIYQLYDNKHINRYMYSDYLRMFRESGFQIVKVENYGPMYIPAETLVQLEMKYGTENDFTCKTMEVVLQKNASPFSEESTSENQPETASTPLPVSASEPVTTARLGLRRPLVKLAAAAQLIYRALVKRLLMPLWQRIGKHNLAIVTRHDVFPVDHGAAAKIYHTARVLSFKYDEVYLITIDREKFYTFRQGQMQMELYPRLLRDLWYPTEPVLQAKLMAAGIPENESFLFYPMHDRNFRLRVLYVALQKRINIYQAEFPAFMDACNWAWRTFGGKRAIVAHNIEFDRIATTYHLPDTVRNYMQAYEVKLCNRADHVIAVSQRDAQGLIAAGVSENRVRVIPHGVDLDKFGPDDSNYHAIRSQYGISENEIVLIFHGIYSYAPNREAAELIESRILPTLNRKGHFPKCLAVGKYPPPQSNHADLIYTDVVAHVAPYIKAADIAIVPLQDGGGTRMKILEYFAAGIPVVATSKGAEGIEVTDGQEIIVCDDTVDFIEAVIRLIRDAELRRQIGQAGRKFVDQLDWHAIGEQYVTLYHARA